MHYYEDLAVGQKFGSGRLSVDAAAIKAFAAAFDPQPFHLDEAAGEASLLGGLAASGWHTAALTMRLLVGGGFRPAHGIIGGGGEELKWLRPVRPGDELHLESEVIDMRLSQSRPGLGFVKLKVTTLNQRDEPVQIFTANLLVPLRAP